MGSPTFTYADVSRAPGAAERCQVSEETRSALAKLGHTCLGHVAATSTLGPVLLSEVWSSEGALAEVTHYQGSDILDFTTLLRDGSVISTEQRLSGVVGLLAAHGVRKQPSSGYHWQGCFERDIGKLAQVHAERVKSALGHTRSSLVAPADLSTYFAIRLRYRELADQAHEIQGQVAKRSAQVALVLAAALLVLAWRLYVRAALLASIAAVAFAFAIVPASFVVGWALIGPVVARRRSVDRVPAEELLERAKRIGFADLPEPPAAVFLPDAPMLTEEHARGLERRDVWLFALDAALPMVAIGAAGTALGIPGIALVLGLDWASNGLVAVLRRMRRLAWLRDQFAGDLVRAEPVEVGTACPLVSPGMAWLQVAMGVAFLALGAWSAGRPAREPMPEWFLPVTVVIAVVSGHVAARRARKRHAARREATRKA